MAYSGKAKFFREDIDTFSYKFERDKTADFSCEELWTKDVFFVIIYIIIHNTVIVYNLSLLSYLFKVKYCISFIWGKEKV